MSICQLWYITVHLSLLEVRSRESRRRAVLNPRSHPRSKTKSNAVDRSTTVGRQNSEYNKLIFFDPPSSKYSGYSLPKQDSIH